MRFKKTFSMFPMCAAAMGLSLLSGCGGGGTGTPSSARGVRYTITDMGAASTSSSKSVSSRFATRFSLRGRGDGGTSPSTTSAALADVGAALPALHGTTINNAGQVVGTLGSLFDSTSAAPFKAEAFLYQGGARTDIGPGGSALSFAYGLNDSGQVVGQAEFGPSAAPHAFLYDKGALNDLGTLGGGVSLAVVINNRGQIAGVSDVALPPADAASSGIPYATAYGYSLSHLFLYAQGKMSDLGTLGNGLMYPLGINDAGEIVGRVDSATQAGIARPQAFHYANGSLAALSTLGGDTALAAAINNSSLIVGQSSNVSSTNAPNFFLHAVTWQNGKIQDLGTLPGGNHSIALGVNSKGDIVGGSTAEPNSLYDHGFVYHNGVMTDLNALIASNTGWLLLGAQSINDQGQIVGVGTVNGQFHLYLLTPAAN